MDNFFIALFRDIITSGALYIVLELVTCCEKIFFPLKNFEAISDLKPFGWLFVILKVHFLP